MDDLERVQAFYRSLQDRVASRREPFRWGTGLFHDGYPGRFDANYLRVERPLHGATPSELAAEADRLMGAFRHREIMVFDADDGDRIAAGMSELGYQTDRLIFMVHGGDVPPTPDDVDVEEFTFAQIRPLLVTIARRFDPSSDGTAEVLADFRQVLVDRVGARFFGVRVDGDPVAYCELYVGDGVAQIEDVNTLEAFRGRGFARAFVTRALREGIEAGADTPFLIADATDWPQHFYRRVGFETVGTFREFAKVPKTPEASTAGA